MDLRELIEVFITYKGKQREMYIDCGEPFLESCQRHKRILQKCSFFKENPDANALVINFEDGKYTVYFTDERAAVWGVKRVFFDVEDTVNVVLDLLGESY